MSATTNAVLDMLNAVIELSGERIVEINNRTQKVAANGTRDLPQWATRYVERQRRKLTREQQTLRALRIARAELRRLQDYIAYKADNEDWTAALPPITYEQNERFSHQSESGR